METGWFCEFRIPRKTGERLYYETADSIYPVFILEKNGFSFIQFQRLEKKCGCCTRAARKTRIVTRTMLSDTGLPGLLRCTKAARKTRIAQVLIWTPHQPEYPSPVRKERIKQHPDERRD